MNVRKLHFCPSLRLNEIQNHDLNVDGVDQVHQHPQSFTALTSSWVDLYVDDHVILHMHLLTLSLFLLLLRLCFDQEILYSEDAE